MNVCGMRLCSLLLTLLLLAGIAVVIAMYFVVVDKVEKALKDYTNICSESNPNFDDWKTPTDPNYLNAWTYNITNPVQYLADGANMEAHEVGPFSFDDYVYRDQVSFSDGGKTINYVNWHSYNFVREKSCENCYSADMKGYTMNIPYINLVHASATNEVQLLLSLACSTTQINYMVAQVTSVPICRARDQATSFVCRCCDVTNLAGNATCASTLSSSGKVGALISYIAKYDGGTKIANTASADVPVSDGVYSPLVVQRSGVQTLFGYPSTLMGFALSANNLAKLANPSTAPTARISLQTSANLTRDMGSVCKPLYCNSLFTKATTIGVGYPTVNILLMKQANCSGVVPHYSVLMAKLGFSEEKAKSLRYLEGAECNVYTPTIVAAALTKVTTNTLPTCVNSGETAPCCALTRTALGPGVGCLYWINGLATNRRVFNAAESVVYTSATYSQRTGCAGDDKFQMTMATAATSFTRWYTPTDSTSLWSYPKTYQASLTSSAPGTFTTQPVTGLVTGAAPGTGISSEVYLKEQFSPDGKAKSDDIQLYSVTQNRPIPLVNVGEEDLDGIRVNRFRDDFTVLSNAESLGQVPYANLQSLLYLKGVPAIASAPNFYQVDSSILTQSDHGFRKSGVGGGLRLYKDNDGYDEGAPKLTTPIPIDSKFLDSYSPNHWSTFFLIEPATGIALGGQGTQMLSTFTPDCNPSLDSTCAMQVKFDSVSRCYVSLIEVVPGYKKAADYPCSAFNVFTPNVVGGKILPIGWVKQGARKTSTKSFKLAMSTKFALDIIVLVVPVVLFILLVLLLVNEFVLRTADRESKMVVVTNLEMAREPNDDL